MTYTIRSSTQTVTHHHYMGMMKFQIGDRIMAYDHKGQRHGKGTVVKSRDRRLLEYIRVQLDDGVAVYFKEALCKRLVRKT